MNSLVKSKFCRTYSPNTRNNGKNSEISQIKQMLLSRSVTEQKKAVSLLSEILTSNSGHSEQSLKIYDFLIASDICVFLSNSMANYDWDMIRNIISCFKLLSRSSNFYAEDHSAFIVSSIVRVINCFMRKIKNETAVNCCLSFLSDIFYSAANQNQSSIISTTTVYNVEQLFELLLNIPENLMGQTNTNLAAGLVVDALVSHTPDNVLINFKSVESLSNVVEKWMPILCNTMSDLVDATDVQNSVDSFYGITCHMGMCSLRLCNYLKHYRPKCNFVQKVITNEEDILNLRVCTKRIAKAVYVSIIHIVQFTKENHGKINNNDYEVFLKFLNCFFVERINTALLPAFSNELVRHGYLQILPMSNQVRNERKISQLCVLNLSEILGSLSKQYLGVQEHSAGHAAFIKELQYGLKDICNDSRGLNQSKIIKIVKPNSILIYLYFFCLSVENPQEVSATFLPYLVQYILSLSKNPNFPSHIIKCLWLLFSMASMSCMSHTTIEDKVHLSKARSRLMKFLAEQPLQYYTHHPSILLWSFSHHSVIRDIQNATLTSWLEKENTLPDEIATDADAQRLIIELLLTSKNNKVLENTFCVLKRCLEELDDLESLALDIWESLPGVYSSFLINSEDVVFNLKYLTELATVVLPQNINAGLYQTISVLIMMVISKYDDYKDGCYLEVISYSMVLAVQVLYLANEHGDNSVLMAFTSRKLFLQNVLRAITSPNNELCSTALEFISNVVAQYSSIPNTSTSSIELKANQLLASICVDDERKSRNVLKLLYAVLNSSPNNSVLVLGPCLNGEQTTAVLKSVMFQLQLFCCKQDHVSSANGWKTLNALLKYSLDLQAEEPIIALTTQPWTHVLIQFQLQQGNLSPDFLNFIKNWLGILKILLKTKISFNVSETSLPLLKCNMMFNTFLMIQNYIVTNVNNLSDNQTGIQTIRNNILNSIESFFAK